MYAASAVLRGSDAERFHCGIASAASDRTYNIGRVATPEEIAGWDIDVRPDGQGLPTGQGLGEGGRRGLHDALCRLSRRVRRERRALANGRGRRGLARNPTIR